MSRRSFHTGGRKEEASVELSEYVTLAKFLKEALGQRYEITLRSTQKPELGLAVEDHALVSEAAPNEVQVGLIRDVLNSPLLEKQAYLCASGEAGKESLFYIRDEDGDIAHVLCISEQRPKAVTVKDVVEDLLRPRESEKTNIGHEVDALMREQIRLVWEKHSLGKAKMVKAQKLAFVEELLDMGLFGMKGTPEMVAQVTGISLASIYRYLGEVI